MRAIAIHLRRRFPARRVNGALQAAARTFLVSGARKSPPAEATTLVSLQMLDRESKREKILEGKLREIKIKLKKQQEQAEARASALLAAQAEKANEEVKVQEEPLKVIPSLDQGKRREPVCEQLEAKFAFPIPVLIETAETEFYQMVEEELQRRAKEVELPDHHEKPKKASKSKPKVDSSDALVDSDTDDQQPEVAENGNGHDNGHHVNGATNGHTNGHSNGHTNGHSDVKA